MTMGMRGRILVIEEQPTLETTALWQQMRDGGWTVDATPLAASAEAVSRVHQVAPDAVVLNLAGAGDTAQRDRYLDAAGRLAVRRGSRQPPVVIVGDPGPAGRPVGVADQIRAPFSAVQLSRRLMALGRLATMQAEMMRRVATASRYGIGASEIDEGAQFREPQVLVVGAGIRYFSIERALARRATLVGAFTVDTAFDYLERQSFDCVVVNMRVPAAAEFIGRLRRNVLHYALPVIVLADPHEVGDIDLAYGAGASDVVFYDGDERGLAERVAILLREHRFRESLKATYARSRDRATNDALTGLYARGFLLEHLSHLVEEADPEADRLSLVGFHIGNLCAVNCAEGYAAGDHLIRQVGTLVGRLVRGEDLAARASGAHFVVVLPDTSLEEAGIVAARVGGVIRASRFALPGAAEAVAAELATSITAYRGGDTTEALLARVCGD